MAVKWLRELAFQLCVDRIHKLLSCQVGMVCANQDREVLGHPSAFDNINANLFQSLRESDNVWCLVNSPAVLQAARPRIDRGDWIG